MILQMVAVEDGTPLKEMVRGALGQGVKPVWVALAVVSGIGGLVAFGGMWGVNAGTV
ncbi:hypothetical protein FA15DRAFT_666866, partial [Coprinopsis marcescibilis]